MSKFLKDVLVDCGVIIAAVLLACALVVGIVKFVHGTPLVVDGTLVCERSTVSYGVSDNILRVECDYTVFRDGFER